MNGSKCDVQTRLTGMRSGCNDLADLERELDGRIILYRNPRGSRNPPKSGKVQKPLIQKPTRTPRTSKNIIKSLVSVLEDNDI